MKTKLIITVMALLFSIIAMAQQKQHLQFKGIPIEGSMVEFCQKLKAKGFTPIPVDAKNVKMFKGVFTGKSVQVGVAATDDGKNVFSVGVFFNPEKDWSSLENTYSYYKEIYTEKYGTPIACVEEMSELSTSNISKMHDLNQGRVTWACQFSAEGGAIQISIEKGVNYDDGYVVIKYQDDQNKAVKRKQDIDDI